MVFSIYDNYGHVALNCRSRIGRGNVGPWRASGMVCYHCHQLRHIVKFCRTIRNQLVNQSKDHKGKKQVDVEETREKMNKIWKNKSDEIPSKDPNSSPSVDNSSPEN